jgi:serine/threonine protein kinase
MSTSRPGSHAGAAPAPKAQKLKPAVFGRYLLLDRIASGGMAEVWRAKIFGADDFQRIIAIKKILPHVCEDQEFVQMFKDEAKITVQLQHANIGQVHELGKEGDTLFIAMEYISGKDGKTIWSYQRQRNAPLPIPLSCMIVQKMCEGLDYAHRKRDNFGTDLRIVHRDVSPQNVLISWEGEIKVIDFGIAKAAGKASKTQAGILKGKFGYMAPEQVRGLPIDQRADVFALGVCLYEFVTGERAFLADSDFSLLEMVRNVELKPPTLINAQVPPEVEGIIYKALAKEADDRYPWASDMAEDLQRYLLMQGKSPSRNDLSNYLRQSFAQDYDKERLRMESYRDLEMPDLPPPKPVVAAPVAPPPNLGRDAVAAALDEEMGLAPSSRAGSQPGSGAPGAAPPLRRPGGGTSEPKVRPAAAPQAAPVATVEAEPAPPKGKGLKPILAGVGIFMGILLVAGGAGMVLRGSGTINITTAPDGAEVQIDGKSHGVTQGDLTITGVSVGTRLLKVVKPGFIPYSAPITMARGAVLTENIRLERMPDPTGVVAVRSKPGGAEIWVDGANTEKVTPAEVELVVGNHVIEVRRKNYANTEKKVGVEEEKKQDVDLVMKPEFISLQLRTIPSGATVHDAARKRLGTTPYTFDAVAVNGPYPSVLIKNAGCKDINTTLAPPNAEDGEQVVSISLNCK